MRHRMLHFVLSLMATPIVSGVSTNQTVGADQSSNPEAETGWNKKTTDGRWSYQYGTAHHGS